MSTLKISINPKLKEVQDNTLSDIYSKFSTKGKVLMIRPTGFGKTYTLVERISKEFIQNNPGKRIMYLYPLDIIKTEIMKGKTYIDDDGKKHIIESKYLKDKLLKPCDKIENIEKNNIIFVSYQLLTLRFNEDKDFWYNYIQDNNIGLIILDEAHRAGSESFYYIFDTFKQLIKPDGVLMIGATATPDRMDDCDDKPSVLEAVFDNVKTYDYGLNDALKDELIPSFVIKHDQYAIDAIDKSHTKYKNQLVEDSYNVELGRLRQTTGMEKDIIASAVREAGYNLATDKYYKFIIFMTNISDISEQADEIAEYFDDAFNKILKPISGNKKNFVIRQIYLASSDNDGELKKLAKKSDNRFYYSRTERIEEIVEQNNYVDLIFTVNMINMGYHVDNISGIMMLRGTKSEITFYQQLGRALSVNAKFRPIIIDSVNNIGEKFWFKKNAKSRNSSNANIPENLEDKVNIHDKIDIKYLGTNDAFEQFMERFKDGEDSSEKLELDFLYNDRQMPLFMIAVYKNCSCKEIVKKLVKCGISIRKEDAEYEYLLEITESLENTLNNFDFRKQTLIPTRKAYLHYINNLRFVNSAQAVSSKCKYIKSKQTTLYEMLNNK